MIPASIPSNESDRLRVLYDLNILDTLEEPEYDDITHLIAGICDVPIALISLIDSERQFLKSHLGLDTDTVSRELGFCPHAILDNGLTVIPDAAEDERFYDNPLVTDGPKVRFYAGAPLTFPGDVRVGTLCIVDRKPRQLSEEQLRSLEILANQVVSLLTLRRTIRQLEGEVDNSNRIRAELERSEKHERTRGIILEKLARGDAIDDVLEILAQCIEAELGGAYCSIFGVDAQRKYLKCLAAPSLPAYYNDAVDGLEIMPGIGSCSTVIATGERVIVSDIQTHPNWQGFSDVAARAGLRTCWSEPVFDRHGEVVATFAIYFKAQRPFGEAEAQVLEQAGKLAGIAIQRSEDERAIIAAKDAAEAANRAKSQFLATMSHEIRTPITGVMGFADMLIEDDLPEDSREKVCRIKYSTGSLLKIVNEILDISKLESGKMEVEPLDFHMPSLLGDVVSHFAQSGNSACDIELNIADGFPTGVNGDPTRIRQVLLNLIGNAVKFTKDGGVRVEARLDRSQSGSAMLHIAVHDTGIGIAKDVVPRLFSDFVQADASISREFEGTGLGLAICKRLVELLGGEIGVESELGVGSTFWFNLPFKPASSDVRPLDGSRVSGPLSVEALRSLKILVAEDNQINQMIIAEVLEKFGHRFEMVNDGNEAVRAHESADFDPILMDVRMPNVSGPDATKMIRAGDSGKAGIPIVAVTADAMAEHQKAYLEAGMTAVATKPIDRVELARAIDFAVGEPVHRFVARPGGDADGASMETEPWDDAAASAAVDGFLSAVDDFVADK